MWIFQEFLTFFKCPNVFFPQFWTYLIFSHRQNIFNTVYGLLIWEILKLDLPVCHGSRQDFIWFEENFTLLLHSIYFVEILEIKPWKSAVCAGTASLQDSFERRKLSFLLVYTFFSHDPLMKRQTRNGMFVPVAQCTA